MCLPKEARRICSGKRPAAEVVEVERDSDGNVVMEGNMPKVVEKGEAPPPKKEGVAARAVKKAVEVAKTKTKTKPKSEDK